MSEWKLSGASTFPAVNAFPARSLRRGTQLGGSWIVAYNEDIPHSQYNAGSPPPSPLIEKVLDLGYLLRCHGESDPEYITKANLSGHKLTSLKRSGWRGLNLVTLDLSENLLTIDAVEPLGRKLEKLEMPFNKMTEIFFNQIQMFSSLRILNLSWNRLSNDCFDRLGELPSLEDLDISGNRISKVKIANQSFQRLKRLKLSKNKIDESSFFELVNLENLVQLYLDQNRITGIPLLTNQVNIVVFINLVILDLSDNPIMHEAELVPAAGFPSLQQLIICRTPLVKSTKGDPPLLKEYLIDRIGIQLQRNEFKNNNKINVICPNRIRIDTTIPKLVKSSVDERIEFYRSQLALEESIRKQMIEGNETEPNEKTESQVADQITDPVSDEIPNDENNKKKIIVKDSFFITQDKHIEVDLDNTTIDDTIKHFDDAEQDQQPQNELENMDNWEVCEGFSDSIMELSADEMVEYSRSVALMPVQSAVHQLKRVIEYGGPRIHNSQSDRLNHQTNPNPHMAHKSIKNKLTLEIVKTEKDVETVSHKIDTLKHREPIRTTELENDLKTGESKTRKTAEELFEIVQGKFNMVRAQSMEDGQRELAE